MQIKKIILGFTNSYLLPGDNGYAMVDAGTVRQQGRFIRGLENLSIKPEQIKLIIITHAHFDHVGSLKDIKTRCNNCPVLIHPHEGELLSRAIVAIPPGASLLGKALSGMGKMVKPLFKFPAVETELIYAESFTLHDYGIDARVIHTPGHTTGSLSVLTGDGIAMSGDLAVNFGLPGFFPPFAVEPEKICESWDLLLKSGAKAIFPGHGKSFSAEELAAEYARRTGGGK